MVVRQPLGLASRQIAVGHEGADAGDAQLAAVGVPSEDEVSAVGGHGIENTQVGRMRDTEGEIRV